MKETGASYVCAMCGRNPECVTENDVGPRAVETDTAPACVRSKKWNTHPEMLRLLMVFTTS